MKLNKDLNKYAVFTTTGTGAYLQCCNWTSLKSARKILKDRANLMDAILAQVPFELKEEKLKDEVK